ncbi:MAG: VTT domain-containing protein [Halioglobus sp.]|nr:VTT domain-containing protein [Halioglobus sp.]
MNTIFTPEENCWRVEHAARAAVLVDGEAYFAALREAMLRAQHAIIIVGWDLHSEVQLLRNGESDEYPTKLGELLNALARDRPSLDIYLLNWDYAIVYALEREFFPTYKLQWRSHERVHFRLDAKHPLGASQHQKLVVIDDRIAFCGGFDLSKWRWDTRQHRIDDARRTDPDGKPYPPFHDVQMLVDAEAARALAEVAWQRWQTATGESPKTVPEYEGDPWPPGIREDFTDVQMAIARTLPALEGRQTVREVEQLYFDSIAAAQDFIYIENQYLTSAGIGDALATRLGEPDGPEIVIVMPRETGGWLEQHTMDVLRARLLRRLRDADLHDRLRVYYVSLGGEPAQAVMIHAKLMVIDDCFLRVASSNLSNRSMGMDAECDLAFGCAPGSDHVAGIRRVRRGLLAEHLDVDVEAVAAAERDHSSLIRAVESLRGNVHTLEPLAADIPEDVDAWVPDAELIDVGRAVEPEEVLDHIVGEKEQGRQAWHYLMRVALLIAAVLGLAALWRFTPLHSWLDVERMSGIARAIQDSALTPLLVPAVYVLCGILVVPMTLLIIVTVSVFGPWLGAFYALLGGELSALVTFWIGHLMGKDTVSRIAGRRVSRISDALSRRGVLVIITLRIVPVAPFSVINVVAGISDIRLRDFAIGNFVGMLPGVVAIAFLADRLVASLRDPSATSIVLLLLATVAVIAAIYGLRVWVQRKNQRRDSAG